MKQQLYYVNFAQAYGEGSYSACTYNDTTSCTTSGGGSTGGGGTGTGTGGGGLADTGFAIVAIVTLACLIIFVSLLIRIWKRPGRTQAVERVEDTTDDIPHDRLNQ